MGDRKIQMAPRNWPVKELALVLVSLSMVTLAFAIFCTVSTSWAEQTWGSPQHSTDVTMHIGLWSQCIQSQCTSYISLAHDSPETYRMTLTLVWLSAGAMLVTLLSSVMLLLSSLSLTRVSPGKQMPAIIIILISSLAAGVSSLTATMAWSVKIHGIRFYGDDIIIRFGLAFTLAVFLAVISFVTCFVVTFYWYMWRKQYRFQILYTKVPSLSIATHGNSFGSFLTDYTQW